MVAGESQKPGIEHLLKFGNHLGLKDGKEIIDEVRNAIAEWKNIAKESDIKSPKTFSLK